jgi:hypothetical protein
MSVPAVPSEDLVNITVWISAGGNYSHQKFGPKFRFGIRGRFISPSFTQPPTPVFTVQFPDLCINIVLFNVHGSVHRNNILVYNYN